MSGVKQVVKLLYLCIYICACHHHAVNKLQAVDDKLIIGTLVTHRHLLKGFMAGVCLLPCSVSFIESVGFNVPFVDSLIA